VTEQTKASEQRKSGPAADLRFLLISALAIVCSFAAFPWHEGAALVILSCCAAALLVWAATSRETIDNVWWPAVRAVGRTLGPVFGGAFALAAAGLGVAPYSLRLTLLSPPRWFGWSGTFCADKDATQHTAGGVKERVRFESVPSPSSAGRKGSARRVSHA
jgi:hypothetical protein